MLGVSQAPERYLPAALCTGADMRLRVEAPSNDVIALVIRAATGQRPGAMPPRIAGGLGYLELISAIRTYTTARSCIGRLVAAAAAKAIVDVGVTEATPFETLRGYGVSHAWGMRLISEIEDWRREKPPSMTSIEMSYWLPIPDWASRPTFDPWPSLQNCPSS